MDHLVDAGRGNSTSIKRGGSCIGTRCSHSFCVNGRRLRSRRLLMLMLLALAAAAAGVGCCGCGCWRWLRLLRLRLPRLRLPRLRLLKRRRSLIRHWLRWDWLHLRHGHGTMHPAGWHRLHLQRKNAVKTDSRGRRMSHGIRRRRWQWVHDLLPVAVDLASGEVLASAAIAVRYAVGRDCLRVLCFVLNVRRMHDGARLAHDLRFS